MLKSECSNMAYSWMALPLSAQKSSSGEASVEPVERWTKVMLSCPYERSGRRRRSGRAGARCDLATAVADASPIARRAGRSRATREGEEGYPDSRQARQRRKARRCCLTVLRLVRLSVQEPLALSRVEQCGSPFPIAHVAGIGPEIELREIARQMRLADVMEGAIDAALEQRKVALHRVRMHVVPHVFLILVADRAVAGKVARERRIDLRFVRHKVRVAANVLDHDRAQRPPIYPRAGKTVR